MQRVTTIAELRANVSRLRAGGRTIGLVPTMGALHAGHVALIRRLAEHVDDLVVSIFVNPTQFDQPDDLAAYPRDLDTDEQTLRQLGADTPALLFVPNVREIYPDEPRVTVTVGGGLTDRLCGASRPGHFDAVATVVTKFLNLVQPDMAAFGRKDRQQLQVIRQLVADLNLPVAILGVPTVREGDGLALSSRNRRLHDAHRRAARALPRALAAAVLTARDARAAGVDLAAGHLAASAAKVLDDGPALRRDYLEVVDPITMQPTNAVIGPDDRQVVAVAAFLGNVRLIDNVEVGDLADEDALLAAVDSSDTPGEN